MIPAWFVSALAFLSAVSLWCVRPMPLFTRISLIVPTLYFGGLYLWATTTPLDVVTRTEYVRIGLILIFLPIIINSLVVNLQRGKHGGRL